MDLSLARTRASACAVLLALVAVCGCEMSTVRLPAESGSVRVPAGSTLEVDLGYANRSAGDIWHMIGRPGHRVLKNLGYDIEGANQGAAGDGGNAAWRFEALSRGRTSLRFQYCYQSSPPDCEGRDGKPPPERIEIAVVVE